MVLTWHLWATRRVYPSLTLDADSSLCLNQAVIDCFIVPLGTDSAHHLFVLYSTNIS
jgi:hypothetical protein